MAITPHGREKIITTLQENMQPETLQIKVEQVHMPSLWSQIVASLKGQPQPKASFKIVGATFKDGVPIQVFDLATMRENDTLDLKSINVQVF